MTRTKTRANANMPNNFVSVLDYGAVGDGVTDDAPAIVAADTAAAALGNALYFPAGTYAVDLSPLGSSLTMSTSWIGEDKNTTKILRKDFKPTANAYILTTTRSRYLTLKGLTFDGQATAVTASDPNVDPAAPGQMAAVDDASESAWAPSYGVQFDQCQNIDILECNFRNFVRAGLRIRGGWNKNYQYNGTYSSSGSTVTVTTSSAHGYTTGDVVYVLFKSGQTSANPVSNYYTITVSSPTAFTVTNTGAAITTSGNCSVVQYQSSDTTPIDGAYRMGKNITVSDCYVERTRGIFGDSFFFSAVENLIINNCSAYDYTRIAYTFEYTSDMGGIRMPCKNVVMSDCISEFGHDAIQAENNIGLWVEMGSQMRFTNISHNDTGMGFALSTNYIDPSLSFDGPADCISLVNCNTRATQRGLELTGTDRSITYDIIGCNFESNQYAAPYAYLYRGYTANCYLTLQDNNETNGDSQRRVVNFTNCTFKNIGWMNARHYGTIFCNKGESTSDTNIDMNTINITDCTSDWLELGDSPSGYVQNKAALITTWEQGGGDADASLRYYHFGDLVICGAAFTDAIRGGSSAYIGRMNVNNFKNLTTGYALVALESRSTESEFRFINTSLQAVQGEAPASSLAGNVYVDNASLFDILEGNFVSGELIITNSTIKDADPNNKQRGSITGPTKYIFSDCTFYKPITLNLRGAAASNKRPLLASLKGCYFFIDTHAEGHMLSLGMGFPLWANVELSGNIFENNRVTSMPSADESIIYMPVNTLAQIYIIGGNNVYDQMVPHVAQFNTDPEYNDVTDTAAYPWDYMPTGYINFFSS